MRSTPVAAREVWPNEAADFTPWLAENIGYLTDALGLDIVVEATEVSVGPFRVDIKAVEVGTEAVVIVENQLESTDHRHLGQLLTYAAGLEARYVVWVATSICDEHQSALRWLNEITPEGVGFFGLVVETIQIGDSPVAVRLNPVVHPDNWSKRNRAVTREGLTATQQAYLDYWAEFLSALHQQHPNWSKKQTPHSQGWLELPAGKSGIYYTVNFTGTRQIRVELYIDPSGPKSADEVFTELAEHAPEIDSRFGAPLSWEPLPGRRASRVAAYHPGTLDQQDAWPEYRQWMLDSVGRLRDAIQPYVDQV